jgi:hypothetical protein
MNPAVIMMENESPVNVISSAIGDVGTIFTSASNMITGNPIAMVFIGFSLVGAGVVLFRKITKKRGS